MFGDMPNAEPCNVWLEPVMREASLGMCASSACASKEPQEPVIRSTAAVSSHETVIGQQSLTKRQGFHHAEQDQDRPVAFH